MRNHKSLALLMLVGLAAAARSDQVVLKSGKVIHGTIVAETAPGCWGPMITPSFRGGHEVTTPVAVEGAEPGDAIAIRIQKVRVTSTATETRLRW